MADLFFYGTLRHVPLLRIVLGRKDVSAVPATLPGHGVWWVAGESFPMIAPDPGRAAPGVLVQGLSDADVARLDFYEGGFAYTLRDVTVDTDAGRAPARVYFPDAGAWDKGEVWDLDDWAARWGRITEDAATEAMAHFGKDAAEDIQALLPFFRARAWSRQLAQEGAPQTLRSTMTRRDVAIRRDRPGYDGFFRIHAFDVDYAKFHGGRSETVSREGFVAFDAALVLPYDPVTDQVLMIEQLRYGPILRDDPAPWTLEPIAGLIDAGEAPADSARREAEEEAGLTLGELQLMTRVYASPGYTSEFFHCYLGLCDLSGYRAGVNGLDSEHEDIRSHLLSFDAAMALVDSGEVNAGPLAMMLLWLARKRDSLRRMG
ncbi:gamma-glutamylcyclotransferase [Aestuariicoccus sp. MJ-SS9]|uniref:gamma-glutamylcyclotransferase n=1 Tax=Aestuariicoccus sp. MJ-SS9 TaxID=3079855 RepID=UPI002915030B|nr:gamma-glutamylcyclotransferase [Aestuariicoccus sp. MJ-SS9]MDU8913205.1 gamma-glutamylcyclotransferase [Aestuariicoccus sp. MJ-SS9]